MENKKSKADWKRVRELAEHKQKLIEERQAERQGKSQKDKNFNQARKIARTLKEDKKNIKLQRFYADQQQSLII
jgi:hypothetical protein